MTSSPTQLSVYGHDVITSIKINQDLRIFSFIVKTSFFKKK